MHSHEKYLITRLRNTKRFLLALNSWDGGTMLDGKYLVPRAADYLWTVPRSQT